MAKQPGRLQYWLSYLFEWPVVHYSSDYNERLKVVLHKGRYKLITDNAIYSFGDLYSNYRKAFDRFKWEEHPVKSCLILGLGMASIPDMLVTRYAQKLAFTAVEIDEVVTKLAYDYVLRPKKINVQVFTSDAASFLDWHTGGYDLICSDVFEGDHIPESLETIEALTAMRDLLNPGGVILYNRLSRYKSDRAKNLKFRDEAFLKVFPNGDYLDVDGNWMFVNEPSFFRESS
jgi:hypothetical protein